MKKTKLSKQKKNYRICRAIIDLDNVNEFQLTQFLKEKYSNTVPSLNLFCRPFGDNVNLFEPILSIKAILFDLDGLLMDTEPIYLEAAQRILFRYGKIYSDDIRVNVIGKAEILGAKVIVDSLNIPMSPEDFLKERDKELEELFPQTKLMPGAFRLVSYFFEHQIPIILATSSNRHSIELKFKNYPELKAMFGDRIVSGTDPEIKRGKPGFENFNLFLKNLFFL